MLSFRSPTVCRTPYCRRHRDSSAKPGRARCRTATRYGVAVDVERAADLYAQGWTLRQIGAELGVSSTTVSEQLRRAGLAMRRGGPPAHPGSTQQILELRDHGLTWNEVAERVGMTRSGAWSRYRRARPPKPQRLGRWQQVLVDALDQNLTIWRPSSRRRSSRPSPDPGRADRCETSGPWSRSPGPCPRASRARRG